MLQFLRTPQWAFARRAILVGIVVVVAIIRYGGSITGFLSSPHPKTDIEITKAEFRPDLPTTRSDIQQQKPIWIIGLRNASRQFTYNKIQLEANYFDKDGRLLEKDTLFLYQRLDPLQEKSLASPDLKERPNAARGTLTVLDAQKLK